MRRTTALAVAVAAFAALAAPASAGTSTVTWGYDVGRTLSIKQNDTVKWQWSGGAGHNVIIVKGNQASKSDAALVKLSVFKKSYSTVKTVKTSGSYQFKFSTKGAYTVYCHPHVGFMRTVVTVG